MKWTILLFFISNTYSIKAERDSVPIAPYLQTKKIPSFNILLMDSISYFSKFQLKKNTPTVIIYFNPDCDHCIKETRNLVDSMNLVQKAQFVFASYAPFPEIKKFDSLFKLYDFSNIKIGRDVKYHIPSFFKVRYTPFVALYDYNGILQKVYEGGTTIKKLAAALELLKP